MKKGIAMLLVLALALGGTALAETELSYEGEVVAGETVPIAAPFGGRMGKVPLKAGDPVLEGDTVGVIQTTLNYAPVEGTIAGVYAAEGDATEGIIERYKAVMYIEPTHKYTIEANSEKAYNSSENYFLHRGERVYLTCITDGTHTGTGIITDVTDSGYTVEVTGGEFYLEEKVYVYRSEDRAKESRLGKGKVKTTTPVEVKGSGCVLKMHVKNGDFVERGELLFETVEGVLDGYYAPDNNVRSPVTGVVSEVAKAAGDTVAKGETLMKVVPSKSFLVQFDVPEGDLFSLKEGETVTMELRWDNTAERIYKGKIVSIARMSEAQKSETEKSDKKVYKAYASFEADENIRLGMTMLINYLADGAEPADAEPVEEPEE